MRSDDIENLLIEPEYVQDGYYYGTKIYWVYDKGITTILNYHTGEVRTCWKAKKLSKKDKKSKYLMLI